MESLAEVMAAMPEAIRMNLADSTSTMSYEEALAKQAEHANQEAGTLQGYDCMKCRNRGFSYAVVDGALVHQTCACVKIRKSLRGIKRSGLADVLERYTLDSFQTEELWQKTIKEGAKRYLANPVGCFYIGGNSGSGKTHLCTAICGELLRRGMSVRYMVWTTEIRALKAVANDEDAYARRFGAFARADVLYIDDLFKVKRGTELTGADVQHTFDIINSRYANRGKLTVISSEMGLQEITKIDEAIGGRIVEMTGGARFYTGTDKNRNWRLR